MRLLILSDLHHELWREFAPRIDPSISLPDAVILAGDINTGAKGVEWAANTFAGLPVLYVAGNHEYYDQNIEDVQSEIEAACQATANVNFLNCSEFILGRTRFLGASLWTDFNLFGDEKRQRCMQEAQNGMNDYQCIRLASKGYRKLRVSDTAQFHAQHKRWLQEKLDAPFDGKTVVITHMAPSIRSVPDKYTYDPIAAAYASNLDHLVAKANVWIHGHTHTSFDYDIAEKPIEGWICSDCITQRAIVTVEKSHTWHEGVCAACGKIGGVTGVSHFRLTAKHATVGRVVCNPCGYMTRGGGRENWHFDPNYIVEIDDAAMPAARN